MLNLTKLEQKLDKALLEETEESLTAWMFSKRNKEEPEEDIQEVLNKYQIKHPSIWDKGFTKGQESYEKSYSREQTFNYLFKYNEYIKESEVNAFLEGAMSGYDVSEKEDYLTNLNEE